MSASWPASGHGLHSGEEAGSPKMTMSQDVVTRFGRALPVRQRPGAWWRGWLFSSGRMPVPPPAGRLSPVREGSTEGRHHAHAEADEDGRDHVLDGVRDHVVALSPTPGRRARRDSGTLGPALPADAPAACALRAAAAGGRAPA